MSDEHYAFVHAASLRYQRLDERHEALPDLDKALPARNLALGVAMHEPVFLHLAMEEPPPFVACSFEYPDAPLAQRLGNFDRRLQGLGEDVSRFHCPQQWAGVDPCDASGGEGVRQARGLRDAFGG